MRPQTPRGFRDVLFAEAAEREAVSRAMSDVLSGAGYDPIETPALEQYRTLELGMGADAEAVAFRLFDLDGSLLALRPEMTVPIARVAATRLAGESGPHRVRYVSRVFREHASLRGQAREFTQVGVELVGARGTAADVEVIALLSDALAAAGLTSFSLGVGTMEVLDALLEAAGGAEEWREAVVRAAHDRNLVEIDRLAAGGAVRPDVAEALRRVPRIRGGAEALSACRETLTTCGCAGALAGIEATYQALVALGYAERVTLDFGMMRSFGYYTGFVVEAYAPGIGLPLAGGGRYDRLLAVFDAPAPAAGFALGLERVMIALAEQEATPKVALLDAVVGGEDPVAVLGACARLRHAGWRVRPACDVTGPALVREADRAGAAEALLAESGRVSRVDRAGEAAHALDEPLPEPPSRTWAARGGERT